MRILGIEFGSWSVKAVEMESRFRRFDILDFHEIRLPLQIVDPAETYRTAVSQLMARLPSHPEKVVTSLPTAQTALRFLQMPLKQRKKVEKMYRYELEDNVPFKLEDSIIEHHVVRSGEGSLVFAAIAPKRFIQAHIDWLKSVGIDPDWLTFEGMGIANLYLTSLANQKPSKEPESEPPEGPVLLLDIGHQKTNVAVFDEDRLQLFRTIGWGGAAVTQALSMTLSISPEDAEKYKMKDLKLGEETESDKKSDVQFAATQAFDTFLADINHSLVSYRALYSTNAVRALITGGTSKMWGIEKFLERMLGLPVSTFRSVEGLSMKESAEKGDESRFGEPLGRSLVFARKTALVFNFRREEMGKGTSLTEVTAFLQNPNVTKLLWYAAVLAILLFVHVNIAGFLVGPQVQTANARVKKSFSDTFRDVPTKQQAGLVTDPANLRKFIEKKTSELDQRLKMLSKTRQPMLSLIRGITETFPPDVKVDVNNLQLDDRRFLMEGVLYEGDLEKVSEALKSARPR